MIPSSAYSPAGASGLFLGLDEFAEVRVLTQTLARSTVRMEAALSRRRPNQEVTSSMDRCSNCTEMLPSMPRTTLTSVTPRSLHSCATSSALASAGPIVHDRTFFFANYEGFREVQASTAIATVPDALAHQGLLPSSSNPGACSNATPSGCVAVPIDPRVQQFLSLFPSSNGADNGDGTGDLITANKGDTNENHGMIRVDHNFSNTHSLFARYIIDDSSSLVPYFGTPPGTYVPGFPSASSSPQSVLYCSGSQESRT